MVKVKVATSNVRGFLKDLFDYPHKKMKFVYKKQNVYNKSKKYKQMLYRVYRKFDQMIPFQIIRTVQEGQDINFSFNRFLKSERPYVIYLENPSALVNYSWRVLIKKKFAKRIRQCLSDKNLKGIVCMSNACKNTVNMYYEIPKHIKIDCIYPLVSEDKEWNIDYVKNKAEQEKVECLFVSQFFRLKGGEDIVETMIRLEEENYPVHITMITNQKDISPEYQEKIRASNCIDVIEFGMSKEKLNVFYQQAAILLHPTRGDSFALVVLEAMKYGCALIATDLYAIPEMIEDGKNGYLLNPYYRNWNKDNTPNFKVMEHHKETILSGFVDEDIVNTMCEILKDLSTDREKLESLCMESYNKALHGMFSEKYIAGAWENLMEEIS